MIIDYFKKKYYWTKVFNELRISLDKFQNEKYLLFIKFTNGFFFC